MSKMHYFSNKFSKTNIKNFKVLSLCSNAPLKRFLWLEVAWFGKIAAFQTDYEEIEL